MDDIRSILVHMDATRHSADRLRLACKLAAQQGAQVRALFAVAPRFVPLPMPLDGGGVPPAPLLDEIDPAHRALAREHFEREAQGARCPLSWSELKGAPPLEGFSREALHVDLMVLGQRDPLATDGFDVPADLVEQALILSGKPAIIVPHHPEPSIEGFPRLSRVLVGWQPRREAARALAEALPLLRRAGEVHLVTWSDARQPATEALNGTTDYLELHGVHGVRTHCRTPPADIGDALLAMAREVGAELLVMGCYGHSRARELVLGGVSRTVLREMHLPTLMAH